MTDHGETIETDSSDDSARPIRWRAVLRDLLLVSVWVLLVTFVFDVLRWPTWTYYALVFGGILIYSVIGDPWARTDS